MATRQPARVPRLLIDVAPEIALQFNVERNIGVDLAKITAGSPTKLWWTGTCGHHFDSNPYNRVKGQGCPYCAGNRVLVGFNDLTTVRPDLAAEWHPILNGDLHPTAVTRSSGKKAWWIDALGHEWETAISGRNRGTGCPYCAGIRVLAGFNDLATLRPDLAAQWNPTKNEISITETQPNANKKAWWICKEGHEWHASINNRANGNGCPICRIPRGEEFAKEKRRRRAEGKPVKKRSMEPGRISQALVPGYNDMATTHPKLAAEFDLEKNIPFTPLTVVAGTATKIAWKCKVGHQWETTGNSRTSSGTGCPICAGQRILEGFNDLATLRPDLASEWHPTRNGERRPSEITVSNGKKAWWIGKCGHEWEAVVASRTGQGVGCPICSGHKTLAGFNDLATLRPDIARSWHPTMNDGVTPFDLNQFSNSVRWWCCDKGHEWQSTVNNRTHGQGCPDCSEGGGFKRSKPGFVYFLEHEVFSAFKVGITNVGTSRLDHFSADGWKVLYLELFEDGAHALAVEGAIKHWWRVDLGLPMWLGPEDMQRTSGWTETAPSAELDELECINRIRRESAYLRTALTS